MQMSFTLIIISRFMLVYTQFFFKKNYICHIRDEFTGRGMGENYSKKIG